MKAAQRVRAMWRNPGAWAAELGQAAVMAPVPTHFPPRAKQLIVVFLTGGVSHVDTFDPKPALLRDHGRVVSAVHLTGAAQQPLMGSPFQFRRYGQSGIDVSELFPHLGGVADELCVIRSMHTDIVEHFQATLAMHTGSATIPLPSLGAWLSYGLGTENEGLPAYVVLCSRLPYAGSQVWDSHFLPPIHQGVRIIPGDSPIADLKSPPSFSTTYELEQQMLDDVNRWHIELRGNDPQLLARSRSFQTARGMMREVPQVLDISDEAPATLDMYDVHDGDTTSIGWQCLVARRLVERGVRVVELIDSGSNNNWDAHGNMQDHRPMAQRVDQPLAALIQDLKQRGMLAETVVAICTEFGRTPWTDGPQAKGRNHYARAFTALLCGAGLQRGVTYGATDEYGIQIVEDPCHVHDYHATILHLLGIDHTKLTYRYAGRDFRLTDVHGNVLTRLLA